MAMSREREIKAGAHTKFQKLRDNELDGAQGPRHQLPSEVSAAAAEVQADSTERATLISMGVRPCVTAGLLVCVLGVVVGASIAIAAAPVAEAPVAEVPVAASLSNSACNSVLPHGERILLQLLGWPYHGSTALEGLLMSSSKVATLCRAGYYQCEARFSYLYKELIDESHCMHPLISPLMNGRTAEVAAYARIWDLRRPVLMLKFPLQIPFSRAGLQSASRWTMAALPPRFGEAGITLIRDAYLLSWRPWCIWNISTHARHTRAVLGVNHWARSELSVIESLVEQHRILQAGGKPVLVIDFSALLWDTQHETRRIQRFLPCLGDLDTDFVPQLGVDIFRNNSWKAHGSIKNFGAAMEPSECCRFDVRTWSCDCNDPLLANLSFTEVLRLRQAVQYLWNFSGHDLRGPLRGPRIKLPTCWKTPCSTTTRRTESNLVDVKGLQRQPAIPACMGSQDQRLVWVNALLPPQPVSKNACFEAFQDRAYGCNHYGRDVWGKCARTICEQSYFLDSQNCAGSRARGDCAGCLDSTVPPSFFRCKYHEDTGFCRPMEMPIQECTPSATGLLTTLNSSIDAKCKPSASPPIPSRSLAPL